MNANRIVLVCSTLFFSISLMAQDADTVRKEKPKRSHLELAATYVTDNVYLGRKDSSVIPYFTPRIGYVHKSGFFTDLSLGYMNASGDSRVDMFAIDAGYTFSAGDYDGEVTATKYFYNSQSTNVRSEVTGSLSYSNGYDFGFIRPSMELSLNFGSKTTDFAASFGLDHTFSVFDDRLDITPTFMANGSTQNYYNNYYRKRRYTINRKNKPPVTGVAAITGEVQNASSFAILDYELSLPLSYTAGKFTFSFSPVYAIPVHPLQVLVTTKLANNTTTSKMHTEKIENSFYGTLGISYKF